MDFLKNAAKIAEQVQGGKNHEGGASGGGGFGDMLGGFMGGGDKPKPKPRRDEEQGYEEERPHGSQSASAEHKKKPSTGELFGDAQVQKFRFPCSGYCASCFLKNKKYFMLQIP